MYRLLQESKQFAELLIRLREGKQTIEDIRILKKRILHSSATSYPIDVPHLFIQNAKVNEFNDRVHKATQGTKYSIKAHDSVIGAASRDVQDKILKQIPQDPRKTKQLHGSLNIAVGERTEISLNTRIDDGMTNGAGNVIKLIQVHDTTFPSGIVWVQFDHTEVGAKTRQENRQLYVGRNRSVQVVRKQFPLRPAAAKTIHRSQGDTESRIVVNFETKRAIPHIHYVGLSRLTAIEGIFITDLCEDKITVSPAVEKEMAHLRNEGKLKLCLSPIYGAPESLIRLSFLNARSLHKHIDDVRADINYLSTDISVFSETRFKSSDSDTMYRIGELIIF